MATKLIKLPPPPGLKKAVIYDQKPAATQGGTFTSGAWRTRDLNTIEGDTGVVSISSNQFSLQAGSYMIYATAPARDVDQHQTRLYNVTTSSVAAVGTAEKVSKGAQCPTSVLSTTLNIGSASTFELQHKCLTSFGTSGFGTSSGIFSGQVDIYASLIILKL